MTPIAVPKLFILATICLMFMVPSSAAPITQSPLKWYGVLQPQPGQESVLHLAHVDAATLELGWDAFEPEQGQVNQAYVAAQRARLKALRNAGLRVFLDLGTQYPPQWVFGLKGATRLVNQYGIEWKGGAGSNLTNAIFNPTVRDAEAAYYSLVAAAFPMDSFAAVRVGGLHMGEMSYPPPRGASNTLWMYDAQAQAASPVPGWKPGTGTIEEARQGIGFYFSSLNNYARWLLELSSRTFPTADLQLLFPSWGIRPGQLTAAINAGLTGTSEAEVNGLITQALDWNTQVRLLLPYGARGVAYTTWLDAPSIGNGIQQISPAEYLHTLAAPRGIALAGENAGGGNQETLRLSISRVNGLGMQGMMWMNASSLLKDPALLRMYSATG